jgi:hypothetical protein
VKRTAQLSVEIAAPPAEVAAALSDLSRMEKLHPLLRSIQLERDADGVRTWRCEDRIFGLELVYFAEQRLEPDGLRWSSVVRQGALLLTNVWSVTATPQGSRVDETMTFEGPALTVLISVAIGVRAHRGLFAAIGRSWAASPA